MSNLVVDQLITTLSQTITLSKNVTRASFRAKLYIHNLPDGEFLFKFKQGARVVSQFSFTAQDLANLIDVTGDYFWGNFAFPEIVVLQRGSYTIELSSSGYSFSSNSFIGWCKDYDGHYGKIDGVAPDFSFYPYSFTLIELEDREIAA